MHWERRVEYSKHNSNTRHDYSIKARTAEFGAAAEAESQDCSSDYKFEAEKAATCCERRV